MAAFDTRLAIAAMTIIRQPSEATSGSLADSRAVESVMASISVRPEKNATAYSPRPFQ